MLNWGWVVDQPIQYELFRIPLLILLCVVAYFDAAPCAHAQKITSVSALSDSTQTGLSMHVSEINGSGFLTLGAVKSAIPIYIAPNDGITDLAAEIVSDTLIEAHFMAGPDYTLQSIVLAPTGGKAAISFVVPANVCRKEDVSVKYEIVPWDQAKNALGNGIAKNFYVVQLSIVNGCAKKIVVPLGGVSVNPVWHKDTSQKCTNDTAKCRYEPGPATVAPFNIDHVTSIFNSDRTSTGSRAMFFNALQAAATIGSAIEPFFGPGFTQGVAILGGGFRTAALQISPDMTAQELKSLTGQSFESSETIGANGTPPVQKYIFIPRNDVKLPSGMRQRVDDIDTLNVIWFVVTDSTNTSAGVKNPATAKKATN
jgi:hypothetical protein